MRPHLDRIVLVALASVILTGVAWAQSGDTTHLDAATASQGPVRVVDDASFSFDDTVDVQLVNVEVWVTDADGNPVRGLTAADFTLLEDRRPMDISYFVEVACGAAADAVDPETETVSEGADAGGVPPPPPEQLPRLVIYVDDLHLTRAQRANVLADLRQSLADGVFDPQRVAVVRQGTEVEMMAPFGSDAETLVAALERMDSLPTSGEAALRAESRLFETLKFRWDHNEELGFGGGNPCGEMSTVGVQEVEQVARGTARSAINTIRQLARLSSALSGVPGTKVVLYAGNGLEVVPGAAARRFLADICPHYEQEIMRNSRSESLISQFQNLSRHANAQRVTLTTLDAGGLRGSIGASIEGWDGAKFRPSTEFERVKADNLQNSLSFLADDTGGRFVHNRNRFDGTLAEIAGDLDHFYSLAYAPPDPGDGGVHLIDVEVDGRKLRVRHRQSYRDKPMDERMADRLQSVLLLGLVSNPLQVSVNHRQIAAEGDHFSVPIEVSLPLDHLLLLDRPGARRGHLRIQLAALDAKGRTSLFHQKAFAIDVDADAETSQRHNFVVDVALRGGPHTLAVAVRDQLSRTTSYVAATVDVQPTPPPQDTAP